MMYWREITVNWGESDPFGLVYYPRMLAWFNDTEHELFRTLGYPIDKMIQNDRTNVRDGRDSIPLHRAGGLR
jgi:acyl-CoA thioesterase FadM